MLRQSFFCILMPAVLLQTACSALPQEGPKIGPVVAVSPGDYGRVMEATVAALRERRYRIDRQDERFGLISTYPRVAAAGFEFWDPDHAAQPEQAASTWNLHRRRVVVRLEPQPLLALGRGAEVPYALQIEAHVERSQMPPRSFSAVRVGRVQSRDPVVETEAGFETRTWRPMGRDHPYEHLLMQAVLEKAGLETGFGKTDP